MTIPRISPYPLPSETALPESRIRFVVDSARAALLVHDVQDYFLDFFDRSTSPIAPMLENQRVLLRTARDRGIPVIYTAQPPEQSREERGLLSEMWGPGITAAPRRSTIAQELKPRSDEIVLTKYRYSAFQRTDLADRLGQLGRDQLIVTGLFAHIGCLLSAADAFMRDLETFFVADALADFSREHHDRALFQVASCTGTVVTTRDLLESIPPQEGPGLWDSEEDLTRELAHMLQLDASDLTSETNLVDMGLDSLGMMTLVERFRKNGTSVTFLDLAETPTLEHYSALHFGRR